MKTRLLAMTAVVSAISMLTACGGGGPGNFTDVPAEPVTPTPPPAPTPTPTVTVTAPATATAGYAFPISWTSTDATSCAADFDSADTGATGTFSKTETAAATKVYSVTCTGAGGNATGTATVVVGAAPTAEGAYQGTTDDDRTISGVVLGTDATSGKNDYWLAYTTSNATPGSRTPAGFVAGAGTSVPSHADTTAMSGNFSSSNLREFNFAAGRVNAQGTLATTAYVKKATLGTVSTPASFTDNDSITNPVFPIQYTVTSVAESPTTVLGSNVPVTSNLAGTAALAANGILTMDVTGMQTLDAAYLNGLDPNTPIDASNSVLAALNFHVQFQFKTTNDAAAIPTYSLVYTTTAGSTDSFYNIISCADNTTGTYPVLSTFPVCGDGSSTPFDPLNTLHPFISVDGNGDPDPSIPAFYNSQTFTWSGGVIKVKSAIQTILQYVTDYTLTPVGGNPPTTRTFSLTYSAGYESAPTVATVAGSYTAGVGGYTGIDATMYTGTTTFSISSSGAIAGAESTTGCSYSGTIAPHTTGNVYDVTAITFTGGSCPAAYTSGTFTGVATYDATAKTLTLTALDAARNNGFMVVATQP